MAVDAMAEVITGGAPIGPALPGGIGPRRLCLGCGLAINAASGLSFDYTPEVPERLILVRVGVWVSCRQVAGPFDTGFNLKTGRGVPGTAAEADTWTDVAPFWYGGNLSRWATYAGAQEFYFKLRMPLDGAARRFCVVGQTVNADLVYIDVAWEFEVP